MESCSCNRMDNVESVNNDKVLDCIRIQGGAHPAGNMCLCISTSHQLVGDVPYAMNWQSSS